MIAKYSLLYGIGFFFVSLFVTTPTTSMAQVSDEEIQNAVREDFKTIHLAIQEYRKKHKDLPYKLSDLVNEGFLEKKDIISPVTEKTGRKQLYPHLHDDVIPESYLYEFSNQEMQGMWGGDKRRMRDWKRLQMGYLGGDVPIVRDNLVDPILNLGFNGKIYESGLNWEENFSDLLDWTSLGPQKLFDQFEKVRKETKSVPVRRPVESKKLSIGTQAPDISFFSLADNEEKRLSDFKGKVVVIDFWASWCGPCQKPMAKMQTYRDKNSDWGNQVELIALSIDKTPEAAAQHLKLNGWTKTYNVWSGEGQFRATPPVIYGVTGIPTAYIIDQEGKVAAAGHPAAMDIPKIVNGLLSGQ